MNPILRNSDDLGLSRSPLPRVYIVDDHPVFVGMLSELLNHSGYFQVVGSAGDGATALNELSRVEVDVLLLDLLMPGMSGLELLERLKDQRRRIRTAVFSGVSSDEAIAAAFARGASAVLGKYAPIPELINALRAVAAGESPMNSHTSGVLRALVQQRTLGRDLGKTDMSVLRRLAVHRTVKEIADELSMSKSAIYKSRCRIMQKLGVTQASRLPSAARKLGLVFSVDGMAAQTNGSLEPRRADDFMP